MGLEQAKIGGFLNNASSAIDQLTAVAKGLLCLPSLIGGFLSGKSIAGIASAVSGAISGAVSGIVSTIIQNEIAFIGNMVAQALRQQYQSIVSIIQTFQMIFNRAKLFKNKVTDTLSYIKGSENCAYAAGSLASCIFAASTNLQSKLRKPAQQLQNFNNQLTDAVAGKSGIINNYVNRNLQGVDKAKMQMNLQSFL